MKILPITNNYQYKVNHKNFNSVPVESSSPQPKEQLNFEGCKIKFIQDVKQYVKARLYADALYNHVLNNEGLENFILRNYSMEDLEGIQLGIKAFKGMSMKDIQYTGENLHVIAVKRGCHNMCGHCYADAKPQNREMSWEDFTTITRGFKTIRERMHGLDIYGQNIPISQKEPIYRTTEFFYDSDCMDLTIKNKKGKIFDFTDLATELYDSMGRKTAFDTSGWNKNNQKLQERAEKYAEYFSNPENMKKLAAFNVSFNTFNASYIASVKARKAGNIEKAERLRNKFTDNMANTLFTFTPIIDNPKFELLTRSFGPKAKNAKYFNHEALLGLINEVIHKTSKLMQNDLNGEQKYIKSQKDYEAKMNALSKKVYGIDTALNSSGRMRKFMEEFKIKAPMQNHAETTPLIIEDLEKKGRFHRYVALRMIDTDGKVYHMDYARFIPTEIQLNIKGKSQPSPKLANTVESFVISEKSLNI